MFTVWFFATMLGHLGWGSVSAGVSGRLGSLRRTPCPQPQLQGFRGSRVQCLWGSMPLGFNAAVLLPRELPLVKAARPGKDRLELVLFDGPRRRSLAGCREVSRQREPARSEKVPDQ